MDRDLLPWILSGVLITSGAVAAAIQFSAANAAASEAVAPAVGPATVPASALTPVAAPPSVLAADVTQPPAHPAAAPAAGSAPLPAGQVWECTVNGQKVFSDTRCGSGASLRQLGVLNVMDAPPPRYVYSQPYGTYPAAAPYPDSEDDGGEVNGDTYPSQIVFARERARREQRRHQEYHARPPAPAHGGPAPRSSH